jgi:hypothetical protein
MGEQGKGQEKDEDCYWINVLYREHDHTIQKTMVFVKYLLFKLLLFLTYYKNKLFSDLPRQTIRLYRFRHISHNA